MKSIIPAKQFGDAEIILVEQKPEVLRAIRQELRDRGSRNVTGTRSLNELQDRSAVELFDLMICNVDGEHQDFVEFNQVIRQGQHGPNPYVVTIGVTEIATEENIKRVMAAGIDSILLKPLSLAAVLDRISALVRLRKSFVVSSDYIGPDRRLRPRQEVCLPLIDVPNTLKDRIEDSYDEARIREAIAATNVKVNRQRTTQDAVLINQIVQQIVPCYDTGRVDDSILAHLLHLQRAAQDIAQRMEETDDAAVGELCTALGPIVETLIANHLTPDVKDVRLLEHVASAIFKAYGTEERVRMLSGDITATIKGARRYADARS